MHFSLEINRLQTPAPGADEVAVPSLYPLLPGETIRLGSSAENEIRLEHPFVSEFHAELTVTAEHVLLADLNSRNGTAVNGLRLPVNQPITLRHGDVIEIGLIQLTLSAVEPETGIEADVQPDGKWSGVEEEAETAVSTALGAGVSTPPPPPPDLPAYPLPYPSDYWGEMMPLGFEKNHSRYVQYLPALYDVPFMHRFLAMFQSMLEPIIWRIDTRDLLIDGQTTPGEFLPWLAGWYAFTFDHTWREAQKRQFLRAAPKIFGLWGTSQALKTVLEIYLDQPVTIIDDHPLPPFTFRVDIPLAETTERRDGIARLINMHKPAHTSYELRFTG